MRHVFGKLWCGFASWPGDVGADYHYWYYRDGVFWLHRIGWRHPVRVRKRWMD